MSTVDSLPDHILTDIFSALTYSSDESRLYAPETLSHVTSHWRAVALDASTLWTFIVATFSVSASQSDRAKAGLHRSKGRAIDLHIDVRDPEWTWESDEDRNQMRSVMVEILQWLGSSHPQWRSLTVLTDTWAPMHMFLAYSTMFTSLPMLEELSLNRCNAFAGLSDAPIPVPSDPVGLLGLLTIEGGILRGTAPNGKLLVFIRGEKAKERGAAYVGRRRMGGKFSTVVTKEMRSVRICGGRSTRWMYCQSRQDRCERLGWSLHRNRQFS
jgi:hypothetical protein